MPIVKYGTKVIEFKHVLDSSLKNAYITVDFYEGVIFKSPILDAEKAAELVKKKSGWILEKLKLVSQFPQGDIVTGSRILYLGRRYYTQLVACDEVKGADVRFNHSKFTVSLNPELANKQEAIESAFAEFYREKSVKKIIPRLNKWIKIIDLEPIGVKFRKLNKRWGSCSKDNEIIINFEAVKLPFSLIDYVIVHELCHLKYKDHSKEFWKLVEKFLPEYKDLDERMMGMRL